ncbi:DUF6816 family protein [Crocosphaera chwakensis]|uniref:DUF6816 domain-containing protein n=1 Tax=Crocosphaera chwakensis CCY0110 TaxID=391612 RepID=A3IP84_9CHRO|nr:hypothetical protein [Crocosphaera chwakensis]EAZ91649.1 hypothetical protein CY0110_25998 [Crocosphaera chwakensis CCY0110]
MKFFVILLLNLFLILAFTQNSQAGDIANRLTAYPNWNSKPNISQAETDLIYPEWMAGTWSVTSILRKQKAPLAPEILTPGFENNKKYLNQSFTFQVRFKPQNLSRPSILSLSSLSPQKNLIVADRTFNGENIAKAYLGDNQVLSVKVPPDNPNRQITFLADNNELISTVTGRSQETPNPQEFLTTEITQQLFQRPSSIYLNEVETTTDYQLINPNKVTAKQVTAIYLSPEDPAYFKAMNRPVALYEYQLILEK